jgi:hypothetical protein
VILSVNCKLFSLVVLVGSTWLSPGVEISSRSNVLEHFGLEQLGGFPLECTWPILHDCALHFVSRSRCRSRHRRGFRCSSSNRCPLAPILEMHADEEDHYFLALCIRKAIPIQHGYRYLLWYNTYNHHS